MGVMMEQIKFLDLKPVGILARQLNVAYDRVFNSGTYIGGKEVEAFENEWAEYCEAGYCIGVGNGHDALALSCMFFVERPYMPNITVPWKTCLPTWSAVRKSMMPIPEDYIKDYRNKYDMAVHIYGQIRLPRDYDKDTLIEDCAQAHGAKLNGVPAGRFGKVAAWSFYPTKNLGALGDAGAITTDDSELANYAYRMRQYGNRDRVGINSRLDPVQAAFLRVKLPYLNTWNTRRRENVAEYMFHIKRDGKVDVPKYILGNESCWHIFAIETDNRDGLRKFLLDNNIETMIHYSEVPYPSMWRIPEAERWASRTLSLPVAPHVFPEQCEKIAELINEWMGA
jgi:dTDP-4-amino-4,6-dideoxygalactose transaminase